MSEIGLNINVDSYNNEGIKTIKGNNNAEIYKLYILKNKRRLSLVGKTVKLGYVMVGTTNGDVIENLNISNAEQGEITFPITNRISKQDGVYSCQLAIYGADEFLEYTATFGLTVEANIFTKIAGAIADSKDFTYIERILEEAKTVSGDLKTNIPVAFNLNTSLESNINNANTVNQTLMATTEQSKVAATEATQKKSELESSLEETKKFIEGLDGSQNIPQIRMDVTELQNGLKSNQSLSYEGSSIAANNTLEGRTEGMRIGGRTLVNLLIPKKANLQGGWVLQDDNIFSVESDGNGFADIRFNDLPIKPNTNYTCYIEILENTLVGEGGISVFGFSEFGNGTSIPYNSKGLVQVKSLSSNKNGFYFGFYKNSIKAGNLKIKLMLIEGDFINKSINYFEGIKSSGEQEDNKISILSNGKNLFNHDELTNGEIVTFNNKRCFKYKDDATNFSLPVNGELGKQYTLSIKIYRDEDKKDKSCNVQFVYSDGTKDSKTFINGALVNYITTLGKRLIKIKGNFNYGYNCYIDLECTQLEEGTQSTQYEPYQFDKKDILIKEPLRSVGDIQDIMYEDNGQVKIDKYVKQYTFTGDEVIGQWANSNDACWFTINSDSFAFNYNSSNDNLICNNFIGYAHGYFSSSNPIQEGLEGITVNSNYFTIRIKKNKLSSADVNGFKAWLKANPTTVIYQLATPVTEIVENCVDIDLDTFQEKTYFSIENSLPGTLDFKVPSNIGSVVQNMAKEVNNIWDVINNLLVPSILDVNKKVALATIKNNLK